MLKRCASSLVIWTLVVGCCLAFQDSSPAPAVEKPSPPAVIGAAAPVRSADDTRVPAAIQEMQALERHARIGMICYSGAFGMPMKKQALPALALNKLQLPRR
jgi:hypothetical protein